MKPVVMATSPMGRKSGMSGRAARAVAGAPRGGAPRIHAATAPKHPGMKRAPRRAHMAIEKPPA
jgi:hypothetical protein